MTKPASWAAFIVGVVCTKYLFASAENEQDHKPTVAMSILFLVLPAFIGVSAVSVLAQKVYVACTKKVQPDSPAIREIGEEFSTSLDTTDSFDEVKFETIPDHTPVSVMWNPFQKVYANVETKNDMPDPMEEMEARFILRKQNKPIPMSMTPSLTSHKALHDFSRVSAHPQPESLYKASAHLGVAIRV